MATKAKRARRSRAGKAARVARPEDGSGTEEPNIVARCIEAAGDIYILAERVGVTYQAIQKWLRTGRVPAERVLAVETAVRRRYRRTDIRPDIYPPRRSKPKSASSVAAAA